MTIETIETVASGAGASAHSPDDAVSLDIAAQPDVLWRMVSDIRNMGRWSPETFSTRWLRGATGPVPGARFRGWNKWHMFFWATNSVIEVAEPGREFAFSTVVWGKKRTRWAYMFEPLSDGARVTETRTVLSNTWFRVFFQRWFMPGHKESFADGMATTLQRLKQAAEAT